jgi:hypothetical protein
VEQLELPLLVGFKFEVVWEEDGKTYSGYIKSVSQEKKTLHVVFYNAAGEEWFIPNLPLNGPDGFTGLVNRYTLTD